MKPFALENVLRHRKRQEDLARNRFTEAKEVAEIASRRHREEKAKLVTLLQEIEEIQREGIEITMLIRYQDQVSQLEKNIAAIEKNLKEKENLMRQTQENLLLKTRERQIMDQLKEEQNRAWRKHLEKKEAMMLDEIAVMRHGAEL